MKREFSHVQNEMGFQRFQWRFQSGNYERMMAFIKLATNNKYQWEPRSRYGIPFYWKYRSTGRTNDPLCITPASFCPLTEVSNVIILIWTHHTERVRKGKQHRAPAVVLKAEGRRKIHNDAQKLRNTCTTATVFTFSTVSGITRFVVYCEKYINWKKGFWWIQISWLTKVVLIGCSENQKDNTTELA